MDISSIITNSPARGEVQFLFKQPEDRWNQWAGERKRQKSNVSTTAPSEPDIPSEPLASTEIAQLELQRLWNPDHALPRLGLALAMARIPPVRSLQLTSKSRFSLCRTSNVVTALIQVGERCDGCASRGAGQFVGCVIPRHPQHQNEIQGVCANHYYNSNGLLCRFGSSNPANESYKIDPLSKTISQFIAVLVSDRLAQLRFRRPPKFGLGFVSGCFNELSVALEKERKWLDPGHPCWGESMPMPDGGEYTAETNIDEAHNSGPLRRPLPKPREVDGLQPTMLSKSEI
ncbi:hypothetical protein CHU98_g794 [Xylaria longipes]|nr:hypothetical protein CHU98_g794 [Xylaria longipes]